MSSPLSQLSADEERDLVDQLTYAALTDSLPEELGVFEGDREAYLDARGTIPPQQRSADEATGFGLEVLVVLTPYVVAGSLAAIKFVGGLLTEAFGESIKDEAKVHLSGLIRRLFGLRTPEGVAAAADAQRAAAALPADTVARVREVVEDALRDKGLGTQDASLVSDAVAGRLMLPG